jgi:hypothetical protein
MKSEIHNGATTGQLSEKAMPSVDRTVKLDHLHHAADLKRLADSLVVRMKTERGPLLRELQEQGVCVVDYGNASAVQCLSQQFSIERRFVWLGKSATLGLQLSAMGRHPDGVERVMAALTLRPDGKALVRGFDREFCRSIEDSDGCDATSAAFLKAVADTAIVGLQTIDF